MKIVILGGSAQSTPGLWSYLNNEARLENLHVILAGRDCERLEAVRRASRLVAEGGGNRLECGPLDRPETWERFGGADIFLIQIRNGGYAGRSVDETFPPRYGVCGDEGLGPGGLSAGLRNWRAIRPALERIERLGAAPLIVFLSSPVGLLVRPATQAFPGMRIAGICELPWTTLLDICRTVGVDPGEVRFDYFGVNHLGWFYRLTAGERDIVREYAGRRERETDFPSGALIHSCGGVPLKYLRLHYEHEKVVNIEAALETRPAPWYRHAVGPLIASLAGRASRIPLFLSVRNDSHFDDDDILECPHVVDGGRLRRLSRTMPVPPHMLELTARFVRYERLATAALLTGDPRDVEKALRIHPWSDGVSKTARMAREIVGYCRTAAA